MGGGLEAAAHGLSGSIYPGDFNPAYRAVKGGYYQQCVQATLHQSEPPYQRSGCQEGDTSPVGRWESSIYAHHVQSDMASHSLTSIPVHSDVVRRLRSLKSADQTWDDFLTDMADDYVPPGWYDEIERRRGPGVDLPMEDVLRRSRELASKGK